MSKIIKKIELYYRNENDNLVSNLSSIESFADTIVAATIMQVYIFILTMGKMGLFTYLNLCFL